MLDAKFWALTMVEDTLASEDVSLAEAWALEFVHIAAAGGVVVTHTLEIRALGGGRSGPPGTVEV